MAKTRINIDSIPVGSWESKNVVCPPPGVKTVSQMITQINHEMFPELERQARRTYGHDEKRRQNK